MATGQERGWAAGFFDGEGHVSRVSNHGRGYYAFAEVGQIRREPLLRFKRIVGVGTIYGPYTPRSHKPHWAPRYSLRIHGDARIRQLLVCIGPLLCSEKRRQFRAAGFKVPPRKR